MQRIAVIICLGTPAGNSELFIDLTISIDLYLIDEPSAMLDAEERVICAKIIKRFLMHNKKTAFVVEHDFLMAVYMADRMIVYEVSKIPSC